MAGCVLVVLGDGACLVVVSGAEEYTVLSVHVVAKRREDKEILLSDL